VKIWKVIVATLVIFAAGFVTGALVLKKQPQPLPQLAPAPRVETPNPMLMQQRFLEYRMKRELNLSPEQTARVEKIFAESGERLRILMDLIGPELHGELVDVRDKIRTELDAEQRDKFEQLLKQRRGDGRKGDGHRGPPMKEDGKECRKDVPPPAGT
jgi:Spy/CpxP family protein refolding chaperone